MFFAQRQGNSNNRNFRPDSRDSPTSQLESPNPGWRVVIKSSAAARARPSWESSWAMVTCALEKFARLWRSHCGGRPAAVLVTRCRDWHSLNGVSKIFGYITIPKAPDFSRAPRCVTCGLEGLIAPRWVELGCVVPREARAFCLQGFNELERWSFDGCLIELLCVWRTPGTKGSGFYGINFCCNAETRWTNKSIEQTIAEYMLELEIACVY